ncbi:MAG: amidohydrolase family protein [Planctomycetota bacterium]
MKLVSALLAVAATFSAAQDLVVFGNVIHTVSSGPIPNGVVVIRDGKIQSVGPLSRVSVPRGVPQLRASVVVPGMIDGRSTAGLTGIYNNSREDQDQLETSAPFQPELRAFDAYNAREDLVAYLRGFGITTVHTGHAPGELITGQTIVVKTAEGTIDDVIVKSPAAVVGTLSPEAHRSGGNPGTRGKAFAMMREQFLKAQERQQKIVAAAADETKEAPSPDLRMDMMVDLLEGKLPFIITANRAQDIDSALRLRDEFGFRLWLDGGAESYLVADRLAQLSVPVIVHPPMARAWGGGEMVNMSMTTPAVLADKGVTVTMQSGYEGYVPKVRVVLFEAAIAAANGLGFERALESITLTPARMLGVDDRVGSIEAGKDGDLALFDGDPFEYTTHCVATVIDGVVVSDTPN